jgi:hypothetical protein
METGTLGLFLGILLTIWGVGILGNASYMNQIIDDAIAHPGVQVMFALIPLIMGSFIVAAHNIWALDRSLIITILGWLMLLSGTFRTVFMKQFIAMLKCSKHLATFYVTGLITTALGVFMLINAV